MGGEAFRSKKRRSAGIRRSAPISVRGTLRVAEMGRIRCDSKESPAHFWEWLSHVTVAAHPPAALPLTPAYPRPRRHAPGPPGAEASGRGAGSARGRGVRCYLDAFRSPQNQLENKAFRAGGETENRPTLCDPAFSREKTQGRAGGAPPTAYPRLTLGLPQGKRRVSAPWKSSLEGF